MRHTDYRYIDHFKSINAIHRAYDVTGDEAVWRLHRQLQITSALRGSDVIDRFGGDQVYLPVILSGTPAERHYRHVTVHEGLNTNYALPNTYAE